MIQLEGRARRSKIARKGTFIEMSKSGNFYFSDDLLSTINTQTIGIARDDENRQMWINPKPNARGYDIKDSKLNSKVLLDTVCRVLNVSPETDKVLRLNVANQPEIHTINGTDYELYKITTN